MKKSRKTYEIEFKKDIVKLYESGSSVAEIQNQYGVAESLIYKWNAQFGIKKNTTDDNQIKENKVSENSIDKLKRKIKDLEEENEILKKAVTIFAQK